MTTTRSDVTLALHHRIQALQLKNLFIARAYGTSLSLIESHILVELAAPGGVSQTELIKALGLHKVTVSRAVAGLVEAGLVQVKAGVSDTRVRMCSLTRSGKEALRLLDENANSLMKQFCTYLTKGQESRLYELWNRLCDALEASPVAHREGVHHLLVPGRRQSRCMGLLGTKVFGEVDLSSLEWHWLSLVRNEAGATAVALAEKLRLIPATATALVHRLIKGGLLTSSPHPTDRRALVLRLTTAGDRILKKVESVAVAQLEYATRGMSRADVTELLELFNRFGVDLMHSSEVVLSADFTVRRATDEQAIARARAFLIRALVECRLDEFATHCVCSPSNHIVVLEGAGGLGALVEISADGCSVLYALETGKVPRVVLSDFVSLCLDLCQERFDAIPALREGGASRTLAQLWHAASRR
jgi:DNA-binding MarR family transcriptional regulator